MTDDTETIQRTWIFQGNPDKYRLSDSLHEMSEEWWNVRQHAKTVRAGDRVLIWISGENAGIYAIGTILTNPEVKPDSSLGLAYWNNPAEGEKPRARVRVRYERRLFERPLLKPYLQTDQELWGLKILNAPRGTNFPVTEAEWLAIEQWLNEIPATE
jgi:predicted RNA-binding protein with PUA-like domain